MNRFFEGVCDLPAGILLWLRVEPGDGPEKQRWIETWCAQHQRIISVDILLVDAHLASEGKVLSSSVRAASGRMTIGQTPS